MAKLGKSALGLGATGVAIVAALSSARSSIPKPPDPPPLWETVIWIASGNDWLALVTAILAGISAAYSIYQMFQKSPATQEDVRDAVAEDGGITRDHLRLLEAKIDALAADASAQSDVLDADAERFGKTARGLARSADAISQAAAEQIADGDPIGAARKLLADARAEHVQRAREAAYVAAPFSPSVAKEAFERVVDLDPTDVWAWIELGRLRMKYGSQPLAEASACFGAALQHVTNERDRSVLHSEFGDVLITEGQLREARSEYEAGLAINERLARQEPGNSEWQRDLTVSYTKLGDVAVTSGDIGEARSRFEAGLVIRERLAGQEPGNSQWQRDLTVSYDRLGDVAVAAGNLGEARSRFEAGLVIRERLAGQEPGNSGWQSDLSVSYGRLALIAEKEGDIPAALAWLRKGEAIMASLAARWPDHPGFARDLGWVRGEIARLG